MDRPANTIRPGRLWCLRWKIRNLPVHLREWLLEDQAARGLGGPPNNWRSVAAMQDQDKKAGKVYFHKRYARFNNDAHEIWIGSTWMENGRINDKWDTFMPCRVFRRLALWYLWRWAWGEWFGLRRWLYYKWLHWHCSKFTRHLDPPT